MTGHVDAGRSVREFEGLDLGDARLNRRLLTPTEAFGAQSQAPINQASADWHDTIGGGRRGLVMHSTLALTPQRLPLGLLDQQIWLLLTNVAIATWQQAAERIGWYCVRPEIESLHKILKSGCIVEECRLDEAERLKPYLALMSIIAWRLLWLTFQSADAGSVVYHHSG